MYKQFAYVTITWKLIPIVVPNAEKGSCTFRDLILELCPEPL